MKKLILSTALALFAAPALADTMWRYGCEWQRADGGNYWFRVDPGCSIGSNAGGGERRVTPPTPTDPGDNGGDEGTDPGDNGGDNGGDKPGKDKPGKDKPGKDKPGHGHGDDNHDHSGPPGKDKPGKGKDRGGRR